MVRCVDSSKFDAEYFNQPLNNWNVSNEVTDMNSMFNGASSFNQPLNNWNVSKVTYVSFMFDGASSGATAPAEPAAAPRAQPDVLAPTPRPGRARLSVATPAPRPRRYATRSSRRGRAD